MLLSKTDRILIAFAILPAKDSFENMLLAHDIKKKVALTADEIKEIGFVVAENGSFKWEDKEKKETEVTITDAEFNYLRARLDEVNKAKEVSEFMLETFKKLKG